MKKAIYVGVLMVLILGLSIVNTPTVRAPDTKYASMDEAWIAMRDLLLPEVEKEFDAIAFMANCLTLMTYPIDNLLAPYLTNSVDQNLATAYAMAAGIPAAVNTTLGIAAIDALNATYGPSSDDILEAMGSQIWNETAGDLVLAAIWTDPVGFYDEYNAAAALIAAGNASETNVTMVATYGNATWAHLTEVYTYFVTAFGDGPLGVVDVTNAVATYVLHMEHGSLAGYGIYDEGIFLFGLVPLLIFDRDFADNDKLADLLNPANSSGLATAAGLAMWLNGSYDATLNATFGLAAGEFEIIHDWILSYTDLIAASICEFHGIDTVPMVEIPYAIMLHQWLYGNVYWFPFGGEIGVRRLGDYLTPIFKIGMDIGNGFEVGTNVSDPDLPVTPGNVTGITWAQAEMLWNPADPYSFVRFDDEVPHYTASHMWVKAHLNNGSTEYTTLKNHFGLNDSQMAYLLDWTTFMRVNWTAVNYPIIWGAITKETYISDWFYDVWTRCDHWAGDTTTYGVTIPAGFRLDANITEYRNRESTIPGSLISVATAKTLFFKYNIHAITNGNSTTGGLKEWLDAIDGNETARTIVREAFSLSRDQMELILPWLESFYSTYVEEPTPTTTGTTDTTPKIPGYSLSVLVGVSIIALIVLYKKRR